MNRLSIILGTSIITLAILSVMTLHLLIRKQVKQNIEIAQRKYTGSPEEALITYLLDETNSTNDRTHIAVWTLGQIKSEKAVPVLKKLFQNDPEGSTCYGNHNEDLCQYELHKAISAIQ